MQGQGYPSYPPQGYPPPQGYTSYPPQGYPPPQGYTSYPPQGYPPPPQQGYPQYPPQGYPQYPPQGYPQYPPQQGQPPQQAPQVVIKETTLYLGGAPQQQQYQQPVAYPFAPTGSFTLESCMNNQVLDVKGSSSENRTPLITYSHHGGKNQVFSFSDGFISTHCGKVMDVLGGKLVPGANVIQYERHGGKNQKWEFYSDGTIRVAGTMLCLDAGCGEQLAVQNYNGQPSQKWRISSKGGSCNQTSTPSVPAYNSSAKHYFLVSDLNGLVLDVMGGSTADRTGVHMWKQHGGDNQKFSFQNDMIYCAHSGKVLEVQGGLKSGSMVVQKPATGGKNQKWEIRNDGTIRVAGTDLCLDIQGENPDQGIRVHVWGHHGRANQKWRLV